MGGPEKPTISPEQLQAQQRAQTDRIEGIQDRVSDDTRNLLLRFGRRAGTPVGPEGLSGGPGVGSAGALGLFGGRKLELLRGMGRL